MAVMHYSHVRCSSMLDITYLCMCGRTRLTEPVTLLDRYFQPLVDRFHQLLRQRCGPRIEHAEATEIVFVNDGMLAEKQDDGRNDVGESNLVVLDNGTELLNLEFRHDDESETGVETLVY